MSAAFRGRRVAATLLAAFAIVIAGGLSTGVAHPPDPADPDPEEPASANAPVDPWSRYPEIDKADVELAGEIDRAVHEDAARRPARSWGGWEDRRYVMLRKTLESDPERARWAMLRLLRERFRNASPGSVARWAVYDEDEEWEAGWLRENGSPATDVVLLRIARDPALDTEIRRAAVVGLCRRGDVRVMEALTDLALDPGEPAGLRKHVLVRLPRFGVRLPERLRDLLYMPFQGVDVVVAAGLAMSGDPEAPSVLLDALRDVTGRQGWNEESRTAALALCALPDLGDDLVRRLRMGASWRFGRGNGPFDQEEHAYNVALVRDVDARLAALPGVRDTAFERDRREYLAGERRRRELAGTSLSGVPTTRGDDFDLGALLVGPARAEGRTDDLERLHRLAVLVARDLGKSRDPERVVSAMNRRLLSSPRVLTMPAEPHDLVYVLRVGWGNCIGLTSLVLAVAERLDVPICGVEAPGHVFARWSDSHARIDIETTEGGARTEDARYAVRTGLFAVDPEDVRRGAILGDLDKRTFAAIALANRALVAADHGFTDEAARFADAAATLAPRNAFCLVKRARFGSRRGPGFVADTVADLEAAEALRRISPSEACDVAGAYCRVRLPDRALVRLDAALARCGPLPEIGIVRAQALVALGRAEEARKELDALPRSWVDRLDVAVVHLEILHATGGDWLAALDQAGQDLSLTPSLHLALAERLLAAKKPAAQDALVVLDRVAELGSVATRRIDPAPAGGAPRRQEAPERRRWFELRVEACEAAGDADGARAARAALLH